MLITRIVLNEGVLLIKCKIYAISILEIGNILEFVAQSRIGQGPNIYRLLSSYWDV